MKLLTPAQRRKLLRNGADPDADPWPVVKLFNPCGAATWLIAWMNPHDTDQLFGLCDLGLGFPELGYVSLSELERITVFHGALGIERDLYWHANKPLSAYAHRAQQAGKIIA